MSNFNFRGLGEPAQSRGLGVVMPSGHQIPAEIGCGAAIFCAVALPGIGYPRAAEQEIDELFLRNDHRLASPD